MIWPSSPNRGLTRGRPARRDCPGARPAPPAVRGRRPRAACGPRRGGNQGRLVSPGLTPSDGTTVCGKRSPDPQGTGPGGRLPRSGARAHHPKQPSRRLNHHPRPGQRPRARHDAALAPRLAGRDARLHPAPLRRRPLRPGRFGAGTISPSVSRRCGGPRSRLPYPCLELLNDEPAMLFPFGYTQPNKTFFSSVTC
jgi:hypothetical protein